VAVHMSGCLSEPHSLMNESLAENASVPETQRNRAITASLCKGGHRPCLELSYGRGIRLWLNANP
jgi:hypothetical protein